MQVDSPSGAAQPSAWLRDAALDVTTNATVPSRLIVILLDDGKVPFNAFTMSMGRRIANGVINQLGPKDFAAVVFVRDNRQAQDFARDRALLRRAVDTYVPFRGYSPNPLEVLRRTSEFLGRLRDVTTAIVFVSSGDYGENDEDRSWLGGRSIETFDSIASQGLSGGGNALVASRLRRVPIFCFSPSGLVAPGPAEGAIRAAPANWRGVEVLRSLANESGGRAIVETNAPESKVSVLFDETSTYYLLGYRSSYPMDGKMRRLHIEVSRRDSLCCPLLVLWQRRRSESFDYRRRPAVRDGSSMPSRLLSPVAQYRWRCPPLPSLTPPHARGQSSRLHSALPFLRQPRSNGLNG